MSNIPILWDIYQPLLNPLEFFPTNLGSVGRPAPLRLRKLNDLCIEIQGPHIALTQKDAVRHLRDRDFSVSEIGKKRGPFYTI